MADRIVPVHYLRPNEREWTPPACLFFDTETDEVADGDRLVLRPVCWSALEVERRTRRAKLRPTTWHDGTDAPGLAGMVDRVGQQYRTLWVWAHNLAFDAAATSLPLRLADAGWDLSEWSVRGSAPWFRLRKGDHRMVLTDSYSWLPEALARIGEAVGKAKPELPERRGDNGATRERCRADVDIMATAILQLMQWWDDKALGNWSLSGATCGWNAYRHMARRRSVVVDPDPAARAFERRAIYGGRRDVWRVGGPWAGDWCDFDIDNAYPTAALNFTLPRRRNRWRQSLDDSLVWDQADRRGVLAECTMTTDVPCVPVSIDRQVWYPTGRFRTVLAGPEMAYYRATGQVSDIGPGFTYDLSGHMAEWARWVLDVATGADASAPPAARVAAKHWSRAVIGKWAARTHERHRMGLATHPGWHVEEASVQGHRGRAGIVDMAGGKWLVVGDVEPDNAFPAVTAWVESTVRLALNRATDAYGWDRVVQCNTDGFLVDAADVAPAQLAAQVPGGGLAPRALAAQVRIKAATEAALPFRLARRGDYTSVAVLGPQHVVKDRQRGFSGVPRAAEAVGPSTFRAHTWPRMTWQMTHGVRDGFVRPEVTWRVGGPFARRWVLADGSTVPPVVRISAAGVTELVPWAETAGGALGLPLTATQHPSLAALL